MYDVVIIRDVKLQDLVSIINHKKQVLRENAAFMGRTLDEWKIDVSVETTWLRQHLQPGGCMFVAIYDGQVIGMLGFLRNERARYKHGGMMGMSIQEHFTGQGIGKKLLTEFLKWAEAEEGLEKVSLEVYASNKRAISLYDKFGFLEDARVEKLRKEADGSYVDDVHMSYFPKKLTVSNRQN
ncbi:N-acetyltransferase family protein [Geomicrobium sp. JSM 1781026]